jgi:hypothetical protein
VPGYVATLVSSVRGPLVTRRTDTRAGAFRAMQELALEALDREQTRDWMHNEIVSIRVEADPTRP